MYVFEYYTRKIKLLNLLKFDLFGSRIVKDLFKGCKNFRSTMKEIAKDLFKGNGLKAFYKMFGPSL
jgi:hypothetical protein